MCAITIPANSLNILVLRAGFKSEFLSANYLSADILIASSTRSLIFDRSSRHRASIIDSLTRVSQAGIQILSRFSRASLKRISRIFSRSSTLYLSLSRDNTNSLSRFLALTYILSRGNFVLKHISRAGVCLDNYVVCTLCNR